MHIIKTGISNNDYVKVPKPGMHSKNPNFNSASMSFKGAETILKEGAETILKEGAETVIKKGAETLISESDKKIINVFSQHYGNIGERLGQKVAKLTNSSKLLKKSSRFSLEEGITSIKEKKIGQSLLENILFPFINLPLYFCSWVLKKAQSIPVLKKGAKKLYYKPIFRIPRKFNELDAKTDMLKGIFEKTQQTVSEFAKKKDISTEKLLNQLNNVDNSIETPKVVKEANEYIKESLYKVSNKFFDKHTGNYNTAYERPLNRIVSGLIPAAFLANDAYNLAVLCGDSKAESQKEANERKKQEISRVFTTAYMQLLTFGAFTKQVNTIPWFTPVTSAFTVLLSETTSRKRLGKPVFFLNKEKAKEYNKKKKLKEQNNEEKTIQPEQKQKDIKQTNVNKNETNSELKINPELITKDKPQIFTSFKASGNKDTVKKQDSKKEEPKKAIINAKTFKKALTILITGGFALSFIKNSSLTKDTKLMKSIKDIGELIKNKIYNPLAFKDFEISKKEFENIMNSLKEAGCSEIAQGHEFIKNKYGKETADGIIKMYKTQISAAKTKDAINAVLNNLKSQIPSLTDSELKNIESSIKVSIENNKTAIAENKFDDIAQKAIEIIQNKKINIDKNNTDKITADIVEELAKRSEKSAIKIDRKLKPFVDIITEPFKFILSAARLPFKMVSSVIKIALSPIEKKAAKALIGEAELSKFESGIHRAVKEIFGEQSAKQGNISQTIFANAMEQFSKKTLPYRKAKINFENALKNQLSKEEIKNAQKIYDYEKMNLLKYVNTAVEKSFNGVTQSSNKNTDLAMMSKLASSAVTSAFLVADNYNMVMIKSDGEEKENAKETANERIIQRLSALFYQTLFINWFNATFRSTYNNSLKGMAAVVIPNTLTTEIVTRKSIGMPVRRKTLDQLQENEDKNNNRKGFLGKYFKFMRLLTGKKPLKDRIPKDKRQEENTVSQEQIKSTTTNLLEKYSK